MFDKYSNVKSEPPFPWAEWRKIVLAHKQPRKLFVQSNTEIKGNLLSLISRYFIIYFLLKIFWLMEFFLN